MKRTSKLSLPAVFSSAVFLVAISTLGIWGCSSTAAYSRCAGWRMTGDMFSSMAACQKCVEENGANLEVVRGCAVGVDAAEFITAINPEPVPRTR